MSGDVGSSKRTEVINAGQSSGIVGITTAGSRALASQLFTFYLRVPVKLFRPTRVDYMVLPKLISPVYNKQPWSYFTHSSPALIYHAVKQHGWSFIPKHVLPPLLANSAVGVVLYTTYLTSMTLVHDKNSDGVSIRETFMSGYLAGGVQSLIAAPIDAIWTRFSAAEALENIKTQTMWSYGYAKLREIGYTGVFAGFFLSFTKESLGYGLYFSTFELIKGKGYRSYVKYMYPDADLKTNKRPGGRSLYPMFVLGAGAAASVAIQIPQYPLGKIQRVHLMRLEADDIRDNPHHKRKPYSMIRLFAKSYYKTFKLIDRLPDKKAGGSWYRWLYGGFWRNTIVSLPSSSIGLLVFEIMRIRFGETVAFD